MKEVKIQKRYDQRLSSLLTSVLANMVAAADGGANRMKDLLSKDEEARCFKATGVNSMINIACIPY